MLSYDLDDRVKVARLLTDAGYSVRNESAANLERFEQRVTDDDWDLIFIDARNPIELIAKIVELAHVHSPSVPVFGITATGQKNQSELMDLGIIDLFSAHGMQHVVSSMTREIAANADRKLAFEASRLQSAVNLAEDERTVLFGNRPTGIFITRHRPDLQPVGRTGKTPYPARYCCHCSCRHRRRFGHA